MGARWVMGIDVGMVSGVAVMRAPDGRAAPLRFDGPPYLSSEGSRDDAGDPRYDAMLDLFTRMASAVPPATRDFDVALTYREGWGRGPRRTLRDAAEAAGLPDPTMVSEPVAAATYLGDEVEPGGHIAVVDFGGGSFDVAVLRRDAEWEVVATGGMPDFGGLDLDSLLLRVIRRRAGDVPLDPRMWAGIRAAREELSDAYRAVVRVGPGKLGIDRDELEDEASPICEYAANQVFRVLGDARVAPHELAGLYLVGGAARMPLMRWAIQDRLGVAPVTPERPEFVVALGAAKAVAPAVAAEPAQKARRRGRSAVAADEPPAAVAEEAAERVGRRRAAVDDEDAADPPAPQKLRPVDPLREARRRRWRRRGIVAATVLGVLAAAAGGTVYAIRSHAAAEAARLAPKRRASYTLPAPVPPTGAYQALFDGGTLFLATTPPDGGTLTAVDVATGNKLWQSAVPGQQAGGALPLLYATQDVVALAVDVGPSAQIVALDRATGKRKWGRSGLMVAELLGSNAAGVQAPVSPSSPVPPYQVLDLGTGKLLWQSSGPVGQFVDRSTPWRPVPVRDPAGVQYDASQVTDSDAGLARVRDLATGKVTTTTNVLATDVQPPMVVGDLAYTEDLSSTGTYTLSAFRTSDAKRAWNWRAVAAADQSWHAAMCARSLICVIPSDPRQEIAAIDAASGEEKWHFRPGGTVRPAALLGDRVVFVGDHGAAVLSAADGKVLGRVSGAYAELIDDHTVLAVQGSGAAPSSPPSARATGSARPTRTPSAAPVAPAGSGVGPATVRLIDVRTGAVTVLGSITAMAGYCRADATMLACPTTATKIQIWALPKH